MAKRADSPPWRVPLFVMIGAVVLAGLGLLGAQVVPPVLANLTSTVADGSPVPLRAEGAEASVVAPVGWLVVRGPWQDDSVQVRSPDGMLSVTLSLREQGPEEVLDDLLAARDAADARVQTEVLTSGLGIRHADGAGGTVFAAVDVDGASVAVESTVAEGADAGVYRPALAEVLAGIGADR